MFTDPKRIRLTDVGHPDECNVFSYYDVFAPDKRQEVHTWCEGAQKGCTDCKKILAESLIESLQEIQDKRSELVKDKDKVIDILNEGRKKACAIAEKTINEVKEVVFKP